MVNKCVVPQCRTGYRNVIPAGVSCHHFPRDQPRRKEWIQAIGREFGWQPSRASRICSLHFRLSDFADDGLVPGQRRRSYLQPRAVPSIFPHTGPGSSDDEDVITLGESHFEDGDRILSNSTRASGSRTLRYGVKAGPVTRTRTHPRRDNDAERESGCQDLASVIASDHVQGDTDETMTTEIRRVGDATVFRRQPVSSWKEFEAFYKAGTFSDIILVSDEGTRVPCHRLVLASFSKVLRRLLLSSEDCDLILLPGFDGEEVKSFVDTVYSLMGQDPAKITDLEKSRLVSVFGSPIGFHSRLRLSPSVCSSTPTAQKKSLLVSRADRLWEDFEPLPKTDLPQTVGSEDTFGKDKGRLSGCEDAMTASTGPVNLEGGTINRDELPPLKRRKVSDHYVRETLSDSDDPTLDPLPQKKLKLILLPLEKLRVRVDKHSMLQDAIKEGEEKLPFRRTRNDWKPRLSVSKFNDRVKDPRKSQLFRSMSDANTSLDVLFMAEKVDVSTHCKAAYMRSCFFFALVGIAGARDRGQGSGSFRIKPLAWSYPELHDITCQFDRAYEAFREVYGLSECDVCYSTLSYSRQGLYKKNKSGKVRAEMKGRFAKLSNQELIDMRSRSEVRKVMERGPIKQSVHFEEDTKCSLSVDPTIPVQELEGIALLTWEVSTFAIRGRLLQVTEAERDEDAKNCVRVLYDTWCVGRDGLRIPFSEYLRKRHDDIMMAVETYNIVMELTVKDPEGKVKETILKKERQCGDCGTVFPYVTVQDEFKFTRHKKQHFYAQYNCDCNVETVTPKEKVRHVKLFHSDGRFVQCDQCTYVGTSKAIENHKLRVHDQADESKSYVCDTCGKMFRRYGSLYVHLLSHKQYVCKHCGQHCEGLYHLQYHRKKFHSSVVGQPAEHRCHVCDQQFLSKRHRNNHFVRKHVAEKDRPHQCSLCDRGYGVKKDLDHHMVMVHLRTKPRLCRYQCGQSFNTYETRNYHERKQHGAIFPTTANRSRSMNTELFFSATDTVQTT